MNILTVSVTRPSQIEPGAFYLLCGTTAGGKLPIPPQLVRIISRPVSRTLLDDPTFEVQMWIDGGPKYRLVQKMSMGLWDVNIPEHGVHDRHLRRLSDEWVKALEQLTNLNHKVRYDDLVNDLSLYKGLYNGRNGK